MQDSVHLTKISQVLAELYDLVHMQQGQVSRFV